MVETDLTLFANDQIELHCGKELERYMRLKALGKSSHAALIGSFGPMFANHNMWPQFVDLIETSDVYMERLPKHIEAQRGNSVWNAEISARALVAVVNDQGSKHSERINAIKELNVMFNITIVDENGKTRSSLSFDDVLRLAAEKRTAAGSKVH
ncbi:hypothetical protein V4C53_30180 [Paraburkholderia azotifigens]|uniref:hypothetical protein n=1 Tax=Paraburkholderia azotifigens TaxID=2057004 RepID=UPI0031794BCD